MDASQVYMINSGFTWFIVMMSLAGYGITLRRTGQKWSLWIVLATGWTLLALINTLMAAGIHVDKDEIGAVWLSSYVLVMASLLMLFLKLVQMGRSRRH